MSDSSGVCECIFFGSCLEILDNKKMRHPLKIQGIIIGNSVAILTKTIVRKKKKKFNDIWINRVNLY